MKWIGVGLAFMAVWGSVSALAHLAREMGMKLSKVEREARERQHSRARRRVFGQMALAAMKRGQAKRRAKMRAQEKAA